jgi:predicted Zn-dependent protease
MDQLFLKETENKTDNHIRIEYQNFNGGGATMEAYSHTDGYFEVHNTIIGINRMLDPVMFQCVALHELGHAMGLGHTETGIMSPIINFTKEYCFLSIRDYINLWKISN